MKKFLVAASSLIAFAAPAFAADMRMPVKAPPPVVAPFSWTGFYVGGNAGYDWGRARINGTETAPVPPFFAVDVAAVSAAASPRINTSGFTGGGQVGYNWQMNSIVLGVEADAEAFNLRGRATSTLPFPSTLPGGPAFPPTSFFSVNSRVSTDWLATFRGRVGWAIDTWLLYATGGAAVTNIGVNQTITLLPPFVFNASSTTTRVGWTVGGGVEYMFARNWSVKAEYLYLNFGTVNSVGVLTPPFAGFAYASSTRLTANIARAGINYHF